MDHLKKALATLEASLVLHDENVAEAATLFAAGKLTQEDFDRATQERAAAIARRGALLAAVEVAKTADAQAAAVASAAAREEAARHSVRLLDERQECAAAIDVAINGLIEAMCRYDELNGQLLRTTSAAGWRNDMRHHMLGMGGVSSALACRIVLARLDNKLDALKVVGGQHLVGSAAEMTARTSANVRSNLKMLHGDL